MHPVLRNILAFIAGLFIGGLVNMLLIQISGSVIAPPPGVDVNDVQSINAHIEDYAPIQLLFPFLAHALGVLVGAFIAARFGATHKMTFALVIGVLFLLGGIGAVMMIPNAPLWFDVLDLGVAYLPMAWLGGRLGGGSIKRGES